MGGRDIWVKEGFWRLALLVAAVIGLEHGPFVDVDTLGIAQRALVNAVDDGDSSQTD